MHSGIRNAVRTTNSTEMPSTPILYLMEPPSQSISSTNWKRWSAGIELAPQVERGAERDERGVERDPARVALGLRVERGDGEHADQREEGDEGEQPEAGVHRTAPP